MHFQISYENIEIILIVWCCVRSRGLLNDYPHVKWNIGTGLWSQIEVKGNLHREIKCGERRPAKMAAGKWFCLFLVSSIFDSTFGNPAGCSEKAGNYDSVRPVRCTKSGTLSNTFSTFSWQRLEVTEYQTGVSAGDFSGFSSASTASFDSSYPHSLTIVCKPGITSFTVAANAFSQFPNVQVLEFLNCPITSIPANAFPGHYLDHLIFTGGKIGSIDANAFSGLNISKLSIPGAVGGITINSELTSGLPEKVFDSLQSMEYLAIDEAKVSTITVGMVGNLTNLRYLNLRNNLITNITDGIFTNMKSLSYLDFEGNKFTCTCTDLWFLKYTAENHIHLLGGPLCETPASHNSKLFFNSLYNEDFKEYVDWRTRIYHIFVCFSQEGDRVRRRSLRCGRCMWWYSWYVNFQIGVQ